MSTSIDERVVQFEIDNKGFERDAARTQKTLEELDESLKLKNGAKSFKDVEEAAAKTNFSSLLKAADTVNDRLSAMGIIGVTALTNITNKAVDAGEKLLKSLTIDQVTQGYSKYEQKTQAIQTIMNATGLGIEDVNTQLEKLNWFTDETSYNFIDMVSNIGKFTSQQIDLEDSVTAMQGIATWAAKSGQGANEASRAMYNLSQAMGVGSVKLMDWKSIQNANMATAEFKQLAIDTASALAEAANDTKKLNELKNVTIQNFDQSLSSGWFSKDVLMGVLKQYGSYADKVYDYINAVERSTGETMTAAQAMKELGVDGYELGASAFKAAQEAKTFTEAIDATKDAVSTGWMTTFETIFGSYDRAKVMWTDLANNLYDIFAVGGQNRNLLLGSVFNSSWSKLTKEITYAGGSVTDFVNTLETTLTEAGHDVDGLKEAYGSLSEVFHQGAMSTSFITMAIQKMADNAESGAGSAGSLENQLQDLLDVATKFRNGDFGKGFVAQQALEEAGYNYKVINKLAIRQHAKMETSVEDLEEILLHYGATLESTSQYTEEEIESLRQLADAAKDSESSIRSIIRGVNQQDGWEMLHDTMNNFLETIVNIRSVIADAWGDIFGGDRAAKGLTNLLRGMKSLSEKILEASEKTERFSNICHTLFSIIDLGVKTVQVAAAGLGAFGRIAQGILGDILGYFGVTGSKFDEVEQQVDTTVSNLAQSLDNTREALNAVDYETFKQNVFDITAALDSFLTKIQKFKIRLRSFKNAVRDAAQPFTNWISEMWQKALPGIQLLMSYFQTLKNSLKVNVVDPLLEFVHKIQSSEHPIKTFFENFTDIGSILLGFKKSADDSIESEPFERLREIVSNYFEPFKTALSEFVDSCKQMFSEFDTSEWIGLIAGSLVFYNITKLTDALYNLSTLSSNITDTFYSLKKLITSKILSPFAFNLKTIAGSVLVLAAAMWVIASIPKERLKQSAIVVVVLMSVLTGLAILLSKMTKPVSPEFAKNMLSISLIMVTVAASVLLLTAALAVIKNLKFENYDELDMALFGLFGVAMTMVITMKYLSMNASSSTKDALLIVAAALGIFILAKTLQKLVAVANTVTFGEMLQLLSVVSIFGLISKAISRIQVPNVLAMAALSAGLTMFVSIFYIVRKLSVTDILKGLGVLVVITGFLAGIVFLFGLVGKYSKVDTKGMAELAAAVALMSVAILAIAVILNYISNNIDNPQKYLSTIVGLTIAVGLLVICLAAASRLANGTKGALKLVLSVTVLTTVVFITAIMLNALKELEISGIKKQLWLFVGIMATMALAVLAIGAAAKMGKGFGLVYTIGLVLALFAIASVLTLLSGTPWEELRPVVTALGITMVAFGVAMALAGFGLYLATKNADKIKAGPILAFLGIVAVVAAAAIALTVLHADWRVVGVLIAGVAGMFIALAVTLRILSRVPELKTSTMVALAASMVALGVTMALMAFAISLLPTKTVGEFAATIFIFVGAVLALVVIIGVFAALAAKVPGIQVGMFALSVVLIAVGIAFIAFTASLAMLDNLNLTGIAAGLSELAVPAGSVGAAGVVMIIGAIGFLLMAVAILALGGAGALAAKGVLAADWAINKVLLTISAIGAAFGLDGLSKLRDELLTSAEIAQEIAEKTVNLMPNKVSNIVDEASPVVEESVNELTDSAQGAIQESGTEVIGTVEEVYGTDVPEAIAENTSKWSSDSGLFSMLGLGDMSDEDLAAMKSQFMDKFSGLKDMDFGQVTDFLSGNFVSNLGGSFLNADYSGSTAQVQEGLNDALSAVSTADSASKVGADWVVKLVDEITSTTNQHKAEEAGKTVINSAESGASTDTSGVGSYFIEGLIKGMNNKTSTLYTAARTIAKNVEKELKDAWGIKSPSRVAETIGGYFMEGLDIGVTHDAPMLLGHIGTIADDAVNAVEEILQNDGSDMRITPVLDLTNVYTQLANFKKSGWSDEIKPNMIMDKSNPSMRSITALTQPSNASVNPDGTSTANGNAPTQATYSFTQNNYSPKALSRIEIYRQTRNQFSGFKELVK